MKLSAVAPVYPTENRKKVGEALKKIFPSTRLKFEHGEELSTVKAEAKGRESLRELHRLLRKEKVLDAARKVMLSSMSADTTRFSVNKEAALIGRLNLSSTSPLGAIEVKIEDENIEGLIDWLAPRTFEGREV